ncbi:MAG: glycerate kinase, partial [Propionicimonas sp.]
LSATQYCYQEAGLENTLAASDLVVTGCTELSALDRGGPVVAAVSRWADAAQRPCVLFTTGAGLARRELRTLGIEAAHLVGSPDPSPAQLRLAGARIAAGWVTGSEPTRLD